MKTKITFKTPDALFYAIQDLSPDDRELVEPIAKKFIKYGEIITVEIDTEKETCTVVQP